MESMKKILALTASCLSLLLVHSAQADTFTDKTAFLTALLDLGNSPIVETLEGVPAGTPVDDGTRIGSITFEHDLPDGFVQVTDGSDFPQYAPHPTTSPSNFLATTDAAVFLDGDDLTLRFAPSVAVALAIVSAEVPNVTLFDEDLRLTANGISAALDIDPPAQDLGDGNLAYFLGVITPGSTFTSAVLSGLGGGYFTYVLDDFMIACNCVPLPATLILMLFGIGLMRQALRSRQTSRSPAV
jgi:hypothetical protein